MATMNSKLVKGELFLFKDWEALYKYDEKDEYGKYLFHLVFPSGRREIEWVLKHPSDLYSKDMVRISEMTEAMKKKLIKRILHEN